MFYYSIESQNFANLLGQVVLYAIVGQCSKFVLCRVEKINKYLVTIPVEEFTWINKEEVPLEYQGCPIIYNK